MTLLAIDPGADAGWAVFSSERRLLACGLSYDGPRSTNPPEQPFDRILVEIPRYRGRFEKNPQSLMTLAERAGRWAGRFERFGPVENLIPNDWKGETKKDIDHRRTWGKLDATELRVLVAACMGIHPKLAPVFELLDGGLSKSDKRANILDAIGIGLHGVGRGSR